MGKRISIVTAIGTDVITEASQLPITDAGEHYDSSTVEGAFQEVGAQLSAEADQDNPEFASTALRESAPLGAELVDETGWTSTGWTGDFATGFTHTPGNTSALTRTMTGTGTKYYQISFDTSAPLASSALELLVSIGNSVGFELYRGSITNYVVGIRSVSDGNLTFTPVTGFDKTISNISVKEITGTFDAPMTFIDSASGQSFAMRPTLESLGNSYIGKNVGQHNTTGDFNVGVGYGVLADNTTGYWNVALGNQAMAANNTGSRNVALGNYALISNISGHRNVAAGSHALYRNTHWTNNIALGADCLWYNTTGNYNIGLGLATLSANTTGSDNVALGRQTMAGATTASGNIGIGIGAMGAAVSGDTNIAIGEKSLYSNNGGAKQIAIGYFALNANTSGTGNTAIGEGAMQANTTGISNTAIGKGALGAGNDKYGIAIGTNALYNAASTNGESVAIGNSALFTNTSGERNVAIGAQALNKNTTGSQNVAIGFKAGIGSGTGVLTRNVLIGYSAGNSLANGGNYNTVVGAASGTTITSGTNNVLLGYNVQTPAATTSAHLNIGNTVYGTLSASKQQIGVGVVVPTSHMHLMASTGAAGLSSLKIDAGTLLGTPEAGSIEYDGTNLYFTDSTGTLHVSRDGIKETDMKFELTEQEAQIVVEALAELPLKISLAVFQKIQAQAAEQIKLPDNPQ